MMMALYRIASIILLIYNYGCTALNIYYMDDLCGKTLKLSAIGPEAAVLKLTRHEEYGSTMNCVTTIMASDNRRIMLKYIQMNIKSFNDCPGDYISVYDGVYHPNNKPRKEPVSQFCGNDIPRSTFTSSNNLLTLRFVSDEEAHGDGFEVILTSFHNGTCSEGEYMCNNKRCISDLLVCNGYDNCGDYSDWCALSVAIISGIVIACFIAIVTIWLCMVFVWYAYTWRRQRLTRRPRRPPRPTRTQLALSDPRYLQLGSPGPSQTRRDVFTIFPQLRISITPIQPPPYPGEPSTRQPVHPEHPVNAI